MQERYLESSAQVSGDTTESPAGERSPITLLMTRTSRSDVPLSIPHTPTFQNSIRQTERTSRFFPNGVPTNFDEIRPIIAQAYSNPMAFTSWFNVHLSGHPPVSRSHELPPSESFVMNIDDEIPSTTTASQPYDPTINHNTTTDNFLNNIREASTNTNNVNNTNNNNSNSSNNSVNNNNLEEQVLNMLPVDPDASELFQAMQNYLPFAAILTLKCIYDHIIGTLCLFVLIFVFVKTNQDLKREIAKQQNQSRKALMHILLHISGALAILYFIPNHAPLFYSTESLFFWELVWSIIVTDFTLKVITVGLKTLLTCLSTGLLIYSKKKQYYLWMEAISQFYRSTVPMYSWISYFKNAYQWPQMTMGFIFIVLYVAAKISELISRWKFLQGAFLKFCQNVSLGESPTKEELAASGGVCVICHEEYSMPIRLHCNHIFCENCVSRWLDRERTCPLCRTAVTDDPIYRDGHTSHFIQLF